MMLAVAIARAIAGAAVYGVSGMGANRF